MHRRVRSDARRHRGLSAHTLISKGIRTRFSEQKPLKKPRQRCSISHFRALMQKAGVGEESLGMIFSGDLLNQCVSSAYGLLDYNVPFIGLFGACSTCAEGLLEAAAFCPSQVKCCACVTSSHNCTSERQFRFPLEYGGQRPPSAQWTVTGAGAFIVSSEKGSASGGRRCRNCRCHGGDIRGLRNKRRERYGSGYGSRSVQHA